MAHPGFLLHSGHCHGLIYCTTGTSKATEKFTLPISLPTPLKDKENDVLLPTIYFVWKLINCFGTHNKIHLLPLRLNLLFTKGLNLATQEVSWLPGFLLGRVVESRDLCRWRRLPDESETLPLFSEMPGYQLMDFTYVPSPSISACAHCVIFTVSPGREDCHYPIYRWGNRTKEMLNAVSYVTPTVPPSQDSNSGRATLQSPILLHSGQQNTVY